MINIIYQFNEKYVPFAGVSMTSLLINNKGAKVNIYALAEDISENSRGKLSKAVSDLGGNIIFPDTKPLIGRFKELGLIPYRGAYSVYLRIFFNELLPEDAKRVIYIDSDTIVDGSLEELVNYDLGGKALGMVLESITDDYKLMIGMDKPDEYFNSGVILFDTDKWRDGKYSDRIVEHINNAGRAYVGDQDYLNIVCKGKICRLPLNYNFQPLHARYSTKQYFKCFGQPPYYSESEVMDAMAHPVIYHTYRWLGDFPWHKGNLHPFNDMFDKYVADSLWSGYVKENASKSPVIRIEKVLYRILPKPVFIRIFRIAHEAMLKKADKDAKAQIVNRNS